MTTIFEKVGLLNAYGGKCHYCGVAITLGTMEVEHATPKSRFGSRAFSNLRPACFRCNRSKGDLTEAEFMLGRLLELSKKIQAQANQCHEILNTWGRPKA